MRFLNNDEDEGISFNYNSYAESRVLRVRSQKANKKEWKCYYCQHNIPVGDGSFYHTGLHNGEFYDYHVCCKCMG